MIRVAIIGTGPVADAHLAAFRRMPAVAPDTTLFAAGVPAGQFTAHFGLDDLTAAADTLRARAPDLLDVCLPLSARHNLSKLLGTVRLPFLLAPPLAPNLAVADQLLKTARRWHLAGTVTHSLRFWPACARLEELVATGAAGTVSRLTVRRVLPAGSSHENSREEFGASEWAMAQAVDLAVWLLGPPTTVTAVADSALELRHAGDAVTSLTLATTSPAEPEPCDHLVLQGACALFECRLPTACDPVPRPTGTACCTVARGQDRRDVQIPHADPMLAELGYLVQATQAHEPWAGLSLAEARRALAVTILAQEALAQHGP